MRVSKKGMRDVCELIQKLQASKNDNSVGTGILRGLMDCSIAMEM